MPNEPSIQQLFNFGSYRLTSLLAVIPSLLPNRLWQFLPVNGEFLGSKIRTYAGHLFHFKGNNVLELFH